MYVSKYIKNVTFLGKTALFQDLKFLDLYLRAT